MGPIRERVQQEGSRGLSLKDHEEFRLRVVEEIAAAGGYLRIVGNVALVPAADEKDPMGKLLRVFQATWWAELHVGDQYHRKIGAVSDSEKEKSLTAKGTGKTDEEAREAAFKAAGEMLSRDLAERLADELEKVKELETPPRDVMLILEGVPDGSLPPLEGILHKLDGIVSAARLRFGGGRLVMTLTTTLDPIPLRDALTAALGPQGYALDSAADEQVKYRHEG
jgi:hypothetical protein